MTGTLSHPVIDNMQKDRYCLIFSTIFFFTTGESNIKFLTISDLANATWKTGYIIKLIIMCFAWKIKIFLTQQEQCYHSHLQLWFPTVGCLSVGKEKQLFRAKENIPRTVFLSSILLNPDSPVPRMINVLPLM